MRGRRKLSAEIDDILRSLEEDVVTSEDTLEEDLVTDATECEGCDEMMGEIDELEAMLDGPAPAPVEDDIMAEIDELETQLAPPPATRYTQEDEEDDDDEITAALDALENSLVQSSEEAPGTEDEIQDTAGGGDPTTSEVSTQGPDAKSETETDEEVFPTNSEYVAKRLDRIASILEENGREDLALRVDMVSNRLEGKNS